jgi:hypothetical protein
MPSFILLRPMEAFLVIRRTISIPATTDALVRSAALPDESYSATVVRLVEEGAKASKEQPRLPWIGAGEGPEDLAENAERYLLELMREAPD